MMYSYGDGSPDSLVPDNSSPDSLPNIASLLRRRIVKTIIIQLRD